jgi:hypothetical protein
VRLVERRTFVSSTRSVIVMANTASLNATTRVLFGRVRSREDMALKADSWLEPRRPGYRG